MAAATAMPPPGGGTSSYPDLDQIPAWQEMPAAGPGPVISPNTAAGSSYRIPRWARAVFSRFPLYEWPAAQVVDSTYEPPPSKPILYVAPGHPLPASLRASAASEKGAIAITGALPGRGWASADPLCLRWQMELVFRGFDFDIRQIEPLESWGPGAHNRLPYLQLPPSFQVTALAPRTGGSSSRFLTSLVGADELPRWVENHAPWKRDRVELREKAAPDAKGKGKMPEDAAMAAEVKTWLSLLGTDPMAGVMLQRALIPHVAGRAEQSKGYLSALLHSHLLAEQRQLELKRVDALSPPTQRSAQGALSAGLGALGGLLSNVSINGMNFGGPQVEDDPSLTGAHANNVDADQIMSAAIEALEALAARIQDDGPWLFEREEPGELDALVFALLHTIMSLPVDSTAKSHPKTLRNVVEQSETLGKWLRRVYSEQVKLRGG